MYPGLRLCYCRGLVKTMRAGRTAVKTLMLMLIVSICVIGYRSPEIMQAIGMAGVAGAAQDPAKLSVESLTSGQSETRRKPMTMEEFTKLSKTDPHAYQKFLDSHEVRERAEVDKLMNFFTRGKYE